MWKHQVSLVYRNCGKYVMQIEIIKDILSVDKLLKRCLLLFKEFCRKPDRFEVIY